MGEERPILVTSCRSDNTSAPNAFTILGLFNIFRPGRDFGAFSLGS